MIVETGILCPESACEEAKELQRAQGQEGVILTHPDTVDAAMGAAFEDRAAFLRQGVKIRTARIGGGTIQPMFGM